MRYSNTNEPIVCMQKNSTCYKNTRVMNVKGVLWHSTGANNTSIARYVQPHESDANYNEMIALIGKNRYGNDWNHISVQAGVNAWIGKLANGTVATVQTMPWNYRPWGCGSGRNGSCNDNWVQFEICEDNLSDKTYFDKVYKEGCELTAYICKMYNLDPYGTINYNGVKVPVVLCHQDSYKLGLGSNHGDVLHWFKKYGKTMDDVRRDVAKLLNGGSTGASASDSAVDILAKKGIINSPDYWEDKQDDLKYLDNLLENIAKMAGSKVVADVKTVSKAISRLVEYKVISSPDYWTKNYSKIKYLDVLLISAANHIGEAEFESYKVKVTTDALNIRKGAGTNYAIVGCIRDEGIYTIVDENNGWGLLKSYAKDRNGWISLAYTKKV